MNPKQFGAFLTEERKAKKLTQKELADRLGVTDKAVSKWERGVCLPDVSKFDDIADALGITDLEVLRAKRLPPQLTVENTAPPPFITGKQFGMLLLGWAGTMAVLFLWELLERGKVVHIIGLGMLLRPLFAFTVAVWLGLRDAKNIMRINWRDVCILMLSFAGLCLLAFLAKQFDVGWRLWNFYQRLFRFNFEGKDATWNYFYSGGIRREPRWMLYWFLTLCYCDFWPFYALVLALVTYPVTKLLCIWHNQKRKTVHLLTM